MKREWKIVTTLGIAAALCGGYFGGIPAVVSLPKHKAEIQQKIYQETKINVDLGNPNLSMGSFPSVWVKSDSISVINKDNSKALYLKNPKVKLKLFPLLFKKIEVARVYADKEDAHLILSKDKKFYLGDYPLEIEKKDSKFKLAKVNMDLGNYNITLDDRYTDKSILINGEYLKNATYRSDDKVSLATKGVFTVDGNSTPYYSDIEIDLPLTNFTDDKLKLNAQLNNFELSQIAPYVEILSKGYVKDLKGQLSVNAQTKKNKKHHKNVTANINTKNLEIIGKDKPSSIIFKEDLDIKTKFETIAGGIKIKTATIEGNGVHIAADGKLSSSGKKIPAMDLRIKVAPSKLEQVQKIIPGIADLLPDMDLYKLKSYDCFGEGETDLHIVGNGARPEVFGSAKIRGIYIIRKGLIADEGASVDLKFRGKVMDISVFVPTEPKQHITVDGWIMIDGSKYSELDIKTTDSVQMEPAQIVLNPLHEIFKFKLGPVPIMKIKGIARLAVQSRGKKVDPHLFGKMFFRNATAEFNDIKNLTLHNGAGEIDFNNTEIPFKTTSATINGQNAQIYGKCNVKGGLDVIAQTQNQNIPAILKVINSSNDMVDVQKVIKPFTHPDGIADLKLNIYGNAKDVEHIEFNKDLFAKGTITLHNATTILQNTYLPLHNINGAVNFDKKDADYDLTGFIRNSKLKVKGTAHDKLIDLVATSDKVPIRDITDAFQPNSNIPFKDEIGGIYTSIIGKYKGLAESGNLDYDKIVVDGKILPNTNSTNPIKVNGGDFNIRQGILKTSQLSGYFYNNPYTLSFTGSDIYKKMKIKDAKFEMNNFNVASLSDITNHIALPADIQKNIEYISDLNGFVDIKGYMKNGGIYSDTKLDNVNFIFKPLNAKVEILNGKANMRGDTLYLGQINSTISSMPLYLNGSISNILKNPYLNLYTHAKLTQKFLDRVYNDNSVYPIKIKGDVKFGASIKGNPDRLHTTSKLNIEEDSSIYYMGATLAGASSAAGNSEGISSNPVEIITNAILTPNSANIKSLKYNQIITSQNKKTSIQNLLNASGTIKLLKDNILGFNNFKIKTSEPTNARIFNIVLKKPTIKQGLFTSDLTINGTSLAPYILGDLNITSVDIPFWDTTIRDIGLKFNEDYIELNSRGSILTNDISMLAQIVNNPNPPYIIENVLINADELNLNNILEKIDDINTDKLRAKQVQDENTITVTPEQIIIKDGQIKADKIIIKKVEATDFVSTLSLGEDKILKDNFKFNIANGTVDGKISSNLSDMEMNSSMNINGTDAQIISENFFDMPGQMYGLVTGNLDIACKGSTSMDCVKTLSGNGHFDVTDGRMPKLGSLEYLLKAANLVTGGITGLSINGIIDLITPLKTGNFDKISGDVKLKNGVATDIDVYSSGKELNMYLTGKYDIPSLVADMEVYGSLSKDFSTVLGKISNMSLNRLFNKIPGININEINPQSSSKINKIPNFDKNSTLRVFKAEIFGDINGSNYVKSFKWIKH